MASIGDLTRAVAKAEDYDENFVSVYARSAREAGLITHKGRGRSAAIMTSRDAANLLIAVNGASLAKDAPEAITLYRKMKALRVANIEEEVPAVFRQIVEPGITFGDALERLIELFITVSYPHHSLIRHLGPLTLDDVEVSFHRPIVHATISIELTKSREDEDFGLMGYFRSDDVDYNMFNGGREEATTINLVTLMAVGQVLAT